MRIILKNLFLLVIFLALLLVFFYKEIGDIKHLHIQNIQRPEKGASLLAQATEYPSVTEQERCVQNTTAANITGFSTLPGHIQDFLYYRHCRFFPMLLNAPEKCGGAVNSADVFLLLVIKSSPGNYDRREVLRKTWAEERLYNGVWIRRIFIVGTTPSGSDNKLLELENRVYKDILQWDFYDRFYNLTLKQVLFLEWMVKNCPNARFLFNGDDDIFANTDNMVLYLQSLEDNDGSKHLFTGNVMRNVGPLRFAWSKYYIPVQVYESNSYPPYLEGGGYLLSSYTALMIYYMSYTVSLIPIDDVYLAICLAKAGLGPTHHLGVRTRGMYIPSKQLDQHDPCYYKEILLVHDFPPRSLFIMWQSVHDPNLKCEHLRKSSEPIIPGKKTIKKPEVIVTTDEPQSAMIHN